MRAGSGKSESLIRLARVTLWPNSRGPMAATPTDGHEPWLPTRIR